ncbi:MAG TPA: hypothetical protein VIY68_10665, partial [Steroidobacteraceae bacterium]
MRPGENDCHSVGILCARQKSGAAEDGAPPAARRYRAKRGGAARAGFPSLAAFERHFANGNRP